MNEVNTSLATNTCVKNRHGLLFLQSDKEKVFNALVNDWPSYMLAPPEQGQHDMPIPFKHGKYTF